MHGDWKDEGGGRVGAAGADEVRVVACPACGAVVRREDAQFCATCGRALTGADGSYLPSDSLRASYHLQGRRGAATLASRLRTSEQARRAERTMTTDGGHTHGAAHVDLFARNRNGASTTALAFVAYSLVPYLGILFCPGALLLGGIGLLRAHRSPHLGGRRASVMSIVYGVIITGAQIFLWWILYKVPEWSRQSPWTL
ncbi:MAG TPA: zinc ribbon domain-containing protein [Pyrinomonadaceae bacterium]|nr:zinc ribbon domain-containing protein [Pyrinomonadaceae bacterium]